MVMLNADREGYGVHVYLLGNPVGGLWMNGASIGQSGQSKGEVRNYAGGKRRAVTWGAVSKTLSLDFSFNPVPVYDQLALWLDEVVVVRSIRGEVVAGLLADLNYVAESVLATGWVGGSLTLQATTDNGTLDGDRRR